MFYVTLQVYPNSWQEATSLLALSFTVQMFLLTQTGGMGNYQRYVLVVAHVPSYSHQVYKYTSNEQYTISLSYLNQPYVSLLVILLLSIIMHQRKRKSTFDNIILLTNQTQLETWPYVCHTVCTPVQWEETEENKAVVLRWLLASKLVCNVSAFLFVLTWES